MMMSARKNNDRWKNGKVLGLLLAFCLGLALVLAGCDFLDSLPFIGKKKEEKPAQTSSVNKDVKPPAGKSESAAKTKEKAREKIEEEDTLKATEVFEDIETDKKLKIEMYSRNRGQMVDPFMPLFRETAEGQPPAPIEEPMTPLQKMTLGEIKLVGVIMAGDNSMGMVEDSSGTSYIVKIGTPIGLAHHRGRVVRIHPEEIDVQQIIQVIDGQKTVIKKLELRPKEGEG